MNRVCIFFANGLEEIEGLTVVDLMRRAGIPVSIISISNSLEIIGAHQIKIAADALFSDMDFTDTEMLVLPGGMPGTTHLAAFAPLCKLLQEFSTSGKYVAAICAAPTVLGELGILKGKKATCYPGMEAKLTGAEASAMPVVIDGNIITSRGMGTAIAFAGELIALLEGRETSDEILESIVYLK